MNHCHSPSGMCSPASLRRLMARYRPSACSEMGCEVPCRRLSGELLGTASPDDRSFLMAATTLFSSRVIAAFATRSRWSAETYETALCRRACVAVSGVRSKSSRARFVSN